MQDILFFVLTLAGTITAMHYLARAHFELVMCVNRKYKERNEQ